MNIADRIQHLRKGKGISQEELADKIGVSRQAVSKWESEQSIPDIDKIIIMSDFFDVTTDYILKGIETKAQAGERKIDANIFAVMVSAINFIGLILASALWYEQQNATAIVIGLVFMITACAIFGIGLAAATENTTRAKRTFWTINIWALLFIPMSLLYNGLFAFALAPYPLIWYGSHITFFCFGLLYVASCFAVVFWARRRYRS